VVRPYLKTRRNFKYMAMVIVHDAFVFVRGVIATLHNACTIMSYAAMDTCAVLPFLHNVTKKCF
jgi:hypothetical protein